MVAVRKSVLLALDLASTVLTLMTGLRENPVLVVTTGRYDLIRSRFLQAKINYNIIRDDLLDATKLADLEEVGASFRFISAPLRSPANLAEDRSTCLRVNSMNASILTLNYDDVFGKGARREQVFLYSISTPHCEVINFQREWVDNCTLTHDGSETQCHQHILDNFDALLEDRLVQVGIAEDFGAPGRPFLKCIGRPQQRFHFITDLMVHQSYWAGGGYHVEVQSSRCNAVPLVRNRDWKWGLFAVEPEDQAASVVFAVHQASWLSWIVSYMYGIVSLLMILRGIFMAFSLSHLVHYIPHTVRKKVFSTGGLLPLVGLEVYAFPPTKRTNIFIARGENLMASDLWMNHWLYILLSICDALLTVRTTYIVLEMGTWMLSKQVNFENFLFICTALTKLTWILCFVHTLVRFTVKVVLSLVKSISCVTTSPVYDFVSWYIDAVAMFMSYKLYSVLLCLYLYMLLKVNGTTTLMMRQKNYKQGVYGGTPDLTNFWGNEIICDLIVICCVLITTGHVLASLLLLTKYRALTHNRVLRLIQDRFVFVGWDLFVVMEALGVDPLTPALVRDGVALTSCSFAALLQQLYMSGPSGLVAFAGDAIFLASSTSLEQERPESDHASQSTDDKLGVLRYPPEVAHAMGLYKSVKRRKSAGPISWRGNKSTPVVVLDDELEPQTLYPDGETTPGRFLQVHPVLVSSSQPAQRPIQRLKSIRESDSVQPFTVPMRQRLPYRFADRVLRIHVEWRWGKIILVDFQNAPGQLVRTADDSLLEFVVQDALTFLKPHEMKDFLGYERQLRIA
ncbi:hypothetical protein Gpo141_00009254 [Globisporangium polare]